MIIFYIAAALILLKFFLIICAYIIVAIVMRIIKSKRPEDNLQTSNAGPSFLMKNIKPMLGGLVRMMGVRSGNIPFHFMRMFLLKYIFKMDISEKAVVYMGYEFRHPQKIHIGKGTIIGNDAKLDGRFGINIGENVNFSTGVWIWTEQHDVNDPDFKTKTGAVTIGDRAWISSRVTILPGVKIGEGAVIAAGAVVTKNVEPYSINGGIPAKKIGVRRKDLVYEFDGKSIAFY